MAESTAPTVDPQVERLTKVTDAVAQTLAAVTDLHALTAQNQLALAGLVQQMVTDGASTAKALQELIGEIRKTQAIVEKKRQENAARAAAAAGSAGRKVPGA
jgi:hypothetical protein